MHSDSNPNVLKSALMLLCEPGPEGGATIRRTLMPYTTYRPMHFAVGIIVDGEHSISRLDISQIRKSIAYDIASYFPELEPGSVIDMFRE